MFKVNDYVIYGSTGVCRITEIGKDEYANSNDTEYYVLHPVFNDNMIIKIPVDKVSTSMRPILTKEEALSLIELMPAVETAWIEDNRERSEYFKAALKSRKSEEWIKLVRTLYHEKEARSSVGKTLTKTDEDIMNAAEKQLNEEFAIALGIAPDKVLPFILSRIPENK